MQDQKELGALLALDTRQCRVSARQNNALLDALDSVSQGVVMCTADRTITYESTSVFDWLGPTGGDSFGVQALTETLSIACYGRRNTRSVELLGPPARSLMINTSPIVGSDGTPLGAIAVIEDTTAGRHHEALLRDFVANVSHELKTPVGAFGLLADALMVEEAPEVRARLLGRMQLETVRVNQVIDDLLSLSSFEVPSQRNHEVLPVAAMVQPALAGLQYTAEHRSIAIDVDVQGSPTLYGSPRELCSVLHHLLENAVKYSPDNSAVQLAIVSEGDWTKITVTDIGIGIAPEYLDRIFERFFRVDDARKRSTGGTGLGLAIVRQVVQHHGGEVRVTSEVGKGSTFVVRLPAQPAVTNQRQAIEGGHDG